MSCTAGSVPADPRRRPCPCSCAGPRFGDFLRIGLPLTLVIALVSAWMARWLWLGGPLLPHFG